MCSFGTILRPVSTLTCGALPCRCATSTARITSRYFALLLDDALQPRGERADHAIGQQHAQKRAGQRAADHRAEHGRRLVDMRHGLDHAEHRGDDAQRRQRIGHRLQSVRAVQLLVQDLLQLTRHDVLDLVRIVGVHADHAQVVADHRAGVVIGEDLRELLEGRAFVGLLDMRLQRHRALGAGQPHQEIQQAQQIDVVRLLVGGAFEHLAEAAERVLHVVHAVRHDEGADRGAADGQHLERHGLDQRLHAAARERGSCRTRRPTGRRARRSLA